MNISSVDLLDFSIFFLIFVDAGFIWVTRFSYEWEIPIFLYFHH